jgi:hypothetical protein
VRATATAARGHKNNSAKYASAVGGPERGSDPPQFVILKAVPAVRGSSPLRSPV